MYDLLEKDAMREFFLKARQGKVKPCKHWETNILKGQRGSFYAEKIGAPVITAGSSLINLVNLFNTRRLWFRVLCTINATGAAIPTWVDYFCGAALSVLNVKMVSRLKGTLFDIDMQSLTYLQYMFSGAMPYAVYQNTTAGGAGNVQEVWIPVDFAILKGLMPLEAMIKKDANAYLSFTPQATATNIFTNAGAAVNSTVVEIYQEMDTTSGLPDNAEAVLKRYKVFSQVLIASKVGQDFKFDLEKTQRLSRALLLVGSAGGLGSVTPSEGITNMIFNLAGVKPHDNHPPSFARARHKYMNQNQWTQFDVAPASGANGNTPGLTGIYPFELNDANDPHQLGQAVYIVGDGDKKFTLDTNANGVYAVLLAEILEGSSWLDKQGSTKIKTVAAPAGK